MPDYPRHLRDFNYTGFHRYSLTFCTFERNRYFTDPAAVALVVAQFLRASREQSVAVAAYCFMPDHVHLLVEGMHEDADLRMFAARAKQYSGFYYKRQFRCTLWQRYAYERVLRATDDAMTAVRYVLENPVRAGLVVNFMDYPHWGSEVYGREALIEFLQGGHR